MSFIMTVATYRNNPFPVSITPFVVILARAISAICTGDIVRRVYFPSTDRPINAGVTPCSYFVNCRHLLPLPVGYRLPFGGATGEIVGENVNRSPKSSSTFLLIMIRLPIHFDSSSPRIPTNSANRSEVGLNPF